MRGPAWGHVWNRRITVVFVAAILVGPVGAAMSPTGAHAKSCESVAGSYEVTPPLAGSTHGADPAGQAAANCTLGFHEEQAYPLSVIGFALLASLGVLVLLRRGKSYDPIRSEA